MTAEPTASPAHYIKDHIRTVPDWPAPGVQFRDITPLLANPRVFRVLIDQFVHRYFDVRPAAIAGLDARGFIIGSVLAYELNVGFVPIRKKGKLPFTTVEETYELEYGSATVEMHTDAVRAGDRVVLIADNYAVESHPATGEPEGCCATLPLHEHCLFKQGIHLGELWHLTPLAEWLRAHGRRRFLLTAPPLRLPGAVGSPVTPVATV